MTDHRAVFSRDSVKLWSVDQFAQIAHHHMRAMVLKLRGIPLTGDADHKPEVPAAPGLHSRESILDDDRSRRLNRQQLCGHQKGIRGGFARQVLRMDRVAIDSYLEEGIELGRL